MKKLSVIIPSRSQSLQSLFLNRAIRSIAKQSAFAALVIDVVIALDKDALVPEVSAEGLAIRFVHSDGHSQCAALNAGVSGVSGDYLAFLEDDDQWQPRYLEFAMLAMARGDFVSSTQLEIDEHDDVVRINDFATPSGWTMPMTTWEKVGQFDAAYRFHLDNDWLGRLTRSGARRIHMVEATAPIQFEVMQAVRPWLHSVVLGSGPLGRAMRHSLLVPLVNRFVHSQSGTSRIASDPELARVSAEEYTRLRERFGHIPW